MFEGPYKIKINYTMMHVARNTSPQRYELSTVLTFGDGGGRCTISLHFWKSIFVVQNIQIFTVYIIPPTDNGHSFQYR